MLIASGFSWFHLIPGVDTDTFLSVIPSHTYTVLSAWFACGLLLVMALFARRGLTRAQARTGLERYTADEGLTARNGAELFLGGVQGMMGDLLDRDDVRAFFPFVAALFAYILTCNLMALVPGFQPPTDSVHHNTGMAILSFLIFMFVGLSRDAVGFVKHLRGPVLLIAPMMFFIEAVSLIVRPVSLSVRLTGNITGDHTVFVIMSDIFPIGLPIPFLALGLLVSVIQAFVFALLSTIYISLSVPHHDEH